MTSAALASRVPALAADAGGIGSRLIGVVALSVALAVATDAFLTGSNLLNVLRQASLVFLLASGLTLVVIAGGLDLSVGANVGLSACLAAAAIKMTGGVAAGVAVALLCGIAIGLANGWMVTFLRLPPFIATYGMLWMVHGATYWYMAGDTIYDFPSGFRAIGSGYLLGVPVPVYLMVASLLGGVAFLRHTTHGPELYAIGANREAARLSGVPVRARLMLAYILSGGMAGLAAVVYLARLNSAAPDIGEPLMLPAVAAVLIGGTSLFGGVGTLGGTLVGALILSVVLNGMNLLAIDANLQPLVTGVIIVLAVWVDVAAHRRADG
jgi:ribose transport system permease protein